MLEILPFRALRSLKAKRAWTLEQRTAELSGIDIGSPVTVSITVPGRRTFL